VLVPANPSEMARVLRASSSVCDVEADEATPGRDESIVNGTASDIVDFDDSDADEDSEVSRATQIPRCHSFCVSSSS